MTENELNEYCWIKKEIDVLSKELNELNTQSLIKSKSCTNIREGQGLADRTARIAVKKEDIRMLLEGKLHELHGRREDIELFVQSVDDIEMRLILRLRFIDGMSWEEIGRVVGYERTTISKKYRRWVKNPTIH